MPFIIKLLATGSLNGGGTLYPVPGTTTGAIVSNIRFVNTGGSAATVNLYFKPNGGSQIRILDRDKSVPAGDVLVVTPELTMAPSDAIEATTSAAMEYVVSGMERMP